MKAWVLRELHSELAREEVDAPTPGPGDLLVRVRACGLCHSDVGAIEGLVPIMTDLPIILGHEVAGEVVQVGAGVGGFAPGDRVVSAGDVMNCPGISRDGGYSEFVIFDASRTVHLPDAVAWDQAAAATDAGITSYQGVAVDGGVTQGIRVGIVGLGGLGLVAARIAVLLGAEVHGVEPKQEVWEAAREQGVGTVVAGIDELAGTDLDVVVDYAGFGTTTAGAVNAVRPGGRVVLVGMGAPEFTIASPGFVLRRIQLVGSTPMGDPAVLRAVLDLMSGGDLRIPTQQIGFDEIPDGLRRLAAGRVQGRLVATLG